MFKVFKPLAAILLLLLAYYLFGRLDAVFNGARIVAVDVASSVGSSTSLHLATYNIAHGRGPVYGQSNWGGDEKARAARLQAIGHYLNESGVDIAVLNEVDFNAAWSDGIDQAAVIAKAGGFAYVARQLNYKANIPFMSLAFGNAVISRYPIVAAERYAFTPLKWYEALLMGNHDALRSVVDVKGVAVELWALHLEYRDEATRIEAVRAVLNEAKPNALLAGDLNSRPSNGGGTSAFDLLLAEPGITTVPDRAGTEFTFPTHKPDRAIDWIIIPVGWQLQSGWVGSFDQSDHLPVHAVLLMPDEQVEKKQ
jgi:endonuclease/exonuclease/phosphatase family metal-dependent hydrolase